MKFKIPKFFTKKRVVWGLIIFLVLLFVGNLIFGGKGKNNGTQFTFVAKQDLKQTVLTTGQVISETDLNLSFQSSGTVKQLLVKEGDQVTAGQLLAMLNTASAYANLTTAQGTLAQANANYDKLIAGATTEDIKTVENTVTAADQDLNASYASALNTLNDAYNKSYNALSTANTIQNTYFSFQDQTAAVVKDNKIRIESSVTAVSTYVNTAKANPTPANIDSAISQMIFSLNTTLNSLGVIRDMCDQGTYYYSVSATDKTALDTQKTNINTSLTSITTSQQDILSYKIALQKAQDQLALKKAPPRQADIDAAKAQVTSAQGQVDAAQAALNNLVLRAPAAGTITAVNIKIGEQATATATAIELQNVLELHTEANVSEANIASLTVGQSIDYTFDALGADEHFSGRILTINPASTVISGVVNYKVTGTLENIEKIKPGMTVNMTILVAEKSGVLAIPSTAVIYRNNAQYVKVVDDKKTLKYHEVQVQAGLQADGGLVEIVSGLSEGQEIITYMK